MTVCGARVLIVEDEAAAADGLRETLERLGYVIAGVASSGEAALELATSTSPSVVIMDMRLDGQLDGIDTAARMRVPVIFLTGRSDEDTLARARAVGPFGYLVKPVRTVSLHAAIQVALTRAALEQRLSSAARLAAVGMTTQNVAHEIANPLAAVLVNLELASGIATRVAATPGMPKEAAEQLAELRAILSETKDGGDRIRKVVQDVRRLIIDDEPRDRESPIATLVDEALGIARGLSRHLDRVERRFGATPRVSAPSGELRRIFTNIALGIAEVIAEHKGKKEPDVWVETSTDELGRAAIVFGTSVAARSSTNEALDLVREIVSALRGELIVGASRAGHTVRVVLPS